MVLVPDRMDAAAVTAGEDRAVRVGGVSDETSMGVVEYGLVRRGPSVEGNGRIDIQSPNKGMYENVKHVTDSVWMLLPIVTSNCGVDDGATMPVSVVCRTQ